jgi:hypothetical protein
MAYLMPTSWTDMDMDWDAPDASNPAYLHAIELAIQERRLALGGLWNSGLSVFSSINSRRIGPREVLRVSWARRIAGDIIDLMTSGDGAFEGYMLPNPDAGEAEETPLVAAWVVLGENARLADLDICGGDLLSGDASVAFLRTCKYFLDRLTTLSLDAGSSEFLVDYWACDRPDYQMGSWDEMWAYFLANATVTIDAAVDGYIRSALLYTYRSYANVNLRYQPKHKIAHTVMGTFALATNFPSYPYNDLWDAADIGLSEGYGKLADIPAGGEQVAIGETTPQAPTSWQNWGYQDPGPYYANEAYTGVITVRAADFACANGFEFYEEPAE